jgi:hypothetical protein
MHCNNGAYYTVVISAAELTKKISKIVVKTPYTWCAVIGFAIVYKHLILFLINYGPCPYIACRALCRR